MDTLLTHGIPVATTPFSSQPPSLHKPLAPAQVLMIQGFLVCRKHADRILLLVEMMQHSGCPCFKAGPRAVQALRRRFHLNLTDTQVRGVGVVLRLGWGGVEGDVAGGGWVL